MSATAITTAGSTAEKPPRRFPPPCWTQDEALALIQAYRSRWYALRRGYLRTADWDAVAEDVGRLFPGAIPPKTSAQCRHKMEKLRQRYRAEKQRALSFPGGHFVSTWFFFQAMDSMERNGNDSVTDNDFNSSGMQIVNPKVNNQLETFGGLNPGRGIRLKPFADGNNLVTLASRANNNVRVSQSYETEDDEDDEIDDAYYAETLIRKNSGKTHRPISQNHASRFQYENMDHSGVRPRKFSKTGLNNSIHGYWNGNDEGNDDDDDDAWVKMGKYDGESGLSRGVKRGKCDDSIGQIVSSIKVLADGFVKIEKMKMDMVHEIESMRMEAEMKRNKMLLESQKQIVEAFVKGLAENRKQQE